MSGSNLNPLVYDFLQLHSSGSIGIRARDRTFRELHLIYRGKFISYFRPLEPIDRRDLEQEIALVLFTQLVKLSEQDTTHENAAGFLYKWCFACVNTFTEKRRERKQYEVFFPDGDVTVTKIKAIPVVPLYKDYHNKQGDLIPALEVIKMFKSGMTMAAIGRHFKCGQDILRQILKNANIPTPRERNDLNKYNK